MIRIEIMRKRSLAFVLVSLFVTAPAAAQGVCKTPKTACIADGGYYAPSDDLARVTGVTEPVFKELRACLDAAGGKHITPAIVIRWDAEGKVAAVKVDVPGYDTLPCVAKASGKLSALQNPHETAMRCEYGCNPPKAAATPPPPPPPPVDPAPAATVAVTAPPPAEPKPAPAPVAMTERQWFGWQTLIADAITMSLFFGGIAAEGDTGGIIALGYLGYIHASPIIHWVHGNVGKGFASFGMRIGMPLVAAGIGAIVGLSTKDNDDDLAGFTSAAAFGAVIGAGLGAAGASLIDALALAYTKPRPIPKDALVTAPKLKLQPMFDVRANRASFGIGGSF